MHRRLPAAAASPGTTIRHRGQGPSFRAAPSTSRRSRRTPAPVRFWGWSFEFLPHYARQRPARNRDAEEVDLVRIVHRDLHLRTGRHRRVIDTRDAGSRLGHVEVVGRRENRALTSADGIAALT